MKIMTNREWIAAGNTGCVFATLFAKKPEKVKWVFTNVGRIGWKGFPSFTEAYLVSIEFPNNSLTGEMWTKKMVRAWALDHGFYEEDTGDGTVGLRRKCAQGVAWVQYFGPDSHVPTRQSPLPMLMFQNRVGFNYYFKVGWKGILHLAHSYFDKIRRGVYDILWERSYKQVEKKIGHKPTIKEAAKTTWLKEDI